ncbi:hypothetical protein T439DRAFT_129192 [Meredithblackwellia eburnea MCA 4105]
MPVFDPRTMSVVGTAGLGDDEGEGEGRGNREDDIRRRYSKSLLDFDALESLQGSGATANKRQQQMTEDEKLTGEWGLSEIMSQLGGGSDAGTSAGGRLRSPSATSAAGFDIAKRAAAAAAGGPSSVVFPTTSNDNATADDEQERLETRSDSGLPIRPTSLSLPSGNLLNTNKDASTTSLNVARTRLKIIERPRDRTQSALDLPTTFDVDLTPSFLTFGTSSSSVLASRPTHGIRPSITSLPGIQGLRTAASASSLGGGFFDDSNSQSFSRPVSRATSLDLNFELGGGEGGTGDRRPSTSSRPLSTISVTPSTFTSRFDPAMIAAARKEIEKDRPVFQNKEAGGPPKLVLMPAPLAGQPCVPFKPPRPEGPDPESDVEEVVEGRGEGEGEGEGETGEDGEPKKPVRPAGALYGRSLMDVLEERQALAKSRQRQFVPGSDGRRAMMDWAVADSPAAAAAVAAKSATTNINLADIHVEGTTTPTSSESAAREPMKATVPKSRSAMSVFGPDLFYQRDLARRMEMDRLEAEEKEAEERREAEVWERERIKQEKKNRKKKGVAAPGGEGKKSRALERHATERKLEGRPVSQFDLVDDFEFVESATVLITTSIASIFSESKNTQRCTFSFAPHRTSKRKQGRRFGELVRASFPGRIVLGFIRAPLCHTETSLPACTRSTIPSEIQFRDIG